MKSDEPRARHRWAVRVKSDELCTRRGSVCARSDELPARRAVVRMKSGELRRNVPSGEALIEGARVTPD